MKLVRLLILAYRHTACEPLHGVSQLYAVRFQTPLSPATAATVPHTPTQALLGKRPPGKDLQEHLDEDRYDNNRERGVAERTSAR